MKTFAAAVLAALLLPGIASGAKPSRISPLVGRWAVDVSRLPMAPEARPRSVTITFAGSADATWSTQVDIVDAGGNASHATGTTRLDGTPATVTGSAEADVAATTMPTPDVLVMSLAKGGAPANTRIYTVAADGRAMVETAAYFGSDGKPILRTHYFTRSP
jgi:outer membrane murein-binding lipoprotein Lpp